MEHTEHTRPNGESGGAYHRGFSGGLQVAVDLCRAGASGDDLARLLEIDPAQADPRGYQDRLAELRKVLGTDGLFGGVSP